MRIESLEKGVGTFRRLVGFVVCLAGASSLLGQVPPELRALEAALTWAAVLDEGRYGEAYDRMALEIRERLNKPTWVAQLQGLRQPWGELASRVALDNTLTDQLPNAPPGIYVVCQFRTKWTGLDVPVREVVVMFSTEDGWQPIGYYTLDEPTEPSGPTR